MILKIKIWTWKPRITSRACASNIGIKLNLDLIAHFESFELSVLLNNLVPKKEYLNAGAKSAVGANPFLFCVCSPCYRTDGQRKDIIILARNMSTESQDTGLLFRSGVR